MTIADWGSLTIAVMILLNAALRFAKGRPNVRLLWASLAMIIPLAGSISVIFNSIDPLVGGQSYVNLFTHLVMVYCQWSVTRATEDTLRAITPRTKDRRPFLLRGWVPIVAFAGTILSFLWLDPEGSSRGVAEYGSHPAYVAYWGFTILPIILPAFNLVPRIWKVRHVVGVPRIVRISLWLLLASYVTSVVVMGAFIAAAAYPVLVEARDSLNTVVLALFALSLLVATAALPPAGERPYRPAPQGPSRAPRPESRAARGRPVTR